MGYCDIVRNINLALSLYPQVNVLKNKQTKNITKLYKLDRNAECLSTSQVL